jgi:hypothetical protein
MLYYAIANTPENSFLSPYTNKQTNNSATFSPQANYTDWATATCRRNLMPTFMDRGISRGQRGGYPTVVNKSFIDRNRYFYFKYLLIYPHKGWVDPVPDPLLLRKSGSAGNRIRDFWICRQEVWPLYHRPFIVNCFAINLASKFSSHNWEYTVLL